MPTFVRSDLTSKVKGSFGTQSFRVRCGRKPSRVIFPLALFPLPQFTEFLTSLAGISLVGKFTPCYSFNSCVMFACQHRNIPFSLVYTRNFDTLASEFSPNRNNQTVVLMCLLNNIVKYYSVCNTNKTCLHIGLISRLRSSVFGPPGSLFFHILTRRLSPSAARPVLSC